ncbi:MAG: hypothetical protein KKH94_11840 [Candidatus Omnitrophica bacterium]|nr:hypothetical protein [Candidatus Omnitrophota bacterium]
MSEIPEKHAVSLGNHYEVDQDINVMILKVDADSRKIALTLKSDLLPEDEQKESPAETSEVSTGTSEGGVSETPLPEEQSANSEPSEIKSPDVAE